MMHPRFVCLVFGLCLSLCQVSCQYAPPVGYAESAPLVQKRRDLASRLLAFLPPEQQAEPAAREEACWLADVSYKASASIARFNDPCLPGWLNNRMVNSNFNLQERGLCWHYAHDLYRELRRRKLEYFRIGYCVRDQGKGSEHNCLFLAAKDGVWPQAIILDAWRYNGRLKLMEGCELEGDNWKEDTRSVDALARIYTECHRYPFEHWARVKSGRKWNDYVPSWSPEGTSSRQGLIMQRNMYYGMKSRGGRLTDCAD